METSRFVKGLVFAWIPLLFFIVPFFVAAFSGISTNRATGLGAVAGGLSEGLATFGLFAMVACDVYGVILLVKTISKGELFTRFLAIVSIGCGSLFVLLLCGLVGWFIRSGTLR